MNSITSLLSLCTLLVLLSACGDAVNEPSTLSLDRTETVDLQSEQSLAIRNDEIRQDILSQLSKQKIEHWIHEDGSIGFFARDAEFIDEAAYAAVGAYAASN